MPRKKCHRRSAVLKRRWRAIFASSPVPAKSLLDNVKTEPSSPPPRPISPQPIVKVCSSRRERVTRNPSSVEREARYIRRHKVKEVEPPAGKEGPCCIKQEPESEYSIPPLPYFPFPSVMNAKVLSYCIPQKPSLQLTPVRDPPSIHVLWNAEAVEPWAPPMDIYSVFVAVETSKGSRVFPEWKTLADVKAIPLPMCVVISKYQPGRRMCFTVVGRDKFGRYGPYSEVVHANMPE